MRLTAVARGSPAMGIKGLLSLFKNTKKRVHLSDFANKRVGIDGYCLLHRGISTCAEDLALNRPTKRYVNYFEKFINMIKRYEVIPIVVFDGLPLPAKASTEEKRKELREVNLQEAITLKETGNLQGAENYFKSCVDVSSDMVAEIIKVLQRLKIDYLVAPYEADAQLAFLNIKGLIEFVITEDSDLLVYGVEQVLFKVDLSGWGDLVSQEIIKDTIGLTFVKFQYMCVIAGCDYAQSLPGIGLNRAMKFVKACNDLSVMESLEMIGEIVGLHALTVSEAYKNEVQQAFIVFNHQIVYDVEERQTSHLKPLLDSTQVASSLLCCGQTMDTDEAYQLAMGNLDVYTKEKKWQFNVKCYQQLTGSIWRDRAFDFDQEPESNSDDEDFTVEKTDVMPSNCAIATRSSILQVIIHELIDHILWIVPCFPVMEIHFVRVAMEIQGHKQDGLINHKDAGMLKNFPVEITCQKHCNIFIHTTEYIVLWKWDIYHELPDDWEEQSETNNYSDLCISDSDLSYISEEESDVPSEELPNGNQQNTPHSRADELDEVSTHTLPFKVLGVAHTKENQSHLEKAFETLSKKNGMVSTYLVEEPKNEKDADAISVQVDYGDGKHHVGYIASELTKYIHPLLRDNKIKNVEIGHIKFRTTWLKIGFYMKLLITRIGVWEPFVISASRKVR